MIGALVHGRCFNIYRTFENVLDGANLNIFCFLSELESWRIDHDGQFPSNIYWQVDGGAENANKYCLAVLELLMARTSITEIIFTRLPVGHTHEDIDGKFGNIWSSVRNENLLSPQQYERHLREVVFRKSENPFDVHDVFCIPDYKKFLNHSIDPLFEGWSRGDYTK